MKSQGKKEIELLYKEIKKRDKVIDDLKEKNIILLRTSLKKGEELKDMEELLDKFNKSKKQKK